MCSNPGARLAGLAAAVDMLAGQDLAALPDPVVAARVLEQWRLTDRVEAEWLRSLTAVDAAARPAPRPARSSRPPPGGCARRAGCSPARPPPGSAPSGEPARTAEQILLDVSAGHDPAVTVRLAASLRHVLDPDGEDAKAQRRHDRRGLRLAPTFDGMLGVDRLLDPEACETVLAVKRSSYAIFERG